MINYRIAHYVDVEEGEGTVVFFCIIRGVETIFETTSRRDRDLVFSVLQKEQTYFASREAEVAASKLRIRNLVKRINAVIDEGY
jgi:hypothetical protein